MIYTANIKAEYHDCDVLGRLKISSAMLFMQQAAGEQLEYLGFSPELLLRENLVFMLTKTCIKIHRMPCAGDNLAIKTAPTAVKGVRFTREFQFASESGGKLLSALTLWVLVNTVSRKILRPASFPYDLSLEPSFAGDDIGDVAMPKITAEPAETGSVDIRYSHLDINRHVGNAVYADFICDALPYEPLLVRGVCTVAINFQHEAKYGEMLKIKRYDLDNQAGEYYICGKSGADTAHFESFVKLGAIRG